MDTFTVLSLQGETLDELVWRALKAGSGTVESVLDLTPGIAALGPRLPAGVGILLPLITITPVAERKTVTLWT